MVQNPLRSLLIASAVLPLALSTCGCSVFGIRTIEEPEYTVVVEDDEFEVREYASYVIAETTQEGDFDGAERRAFYRLFNYISGANVGSNSLAMTAPVIQEPDEAEGEKLAMTAPVLQERTDADGEGAWTMAFVLPSDVTIDTAPVPTNPEVRIREIPAKRVATVRFSGLRTVEKFETQSKRLLDWVAEQGFRTTSEPRHAGYDPPFTIPIFRRNELLVDVASTETSVQP